MLAWNQMHHHHVCDNQNKANEMIIELNNFANNVNDNDVLRGREITHILTQMNTTINVVRNNYENQMNVMRGQMEELRTEIQYMLCEINRLNTIIHAPPPPPPVPVPPPPPMPLVPAYTKEELCAELLESIEDTKQQMQDQTYRTLTDKLMEIYNR